MCTLGNIGTAVWYTQTLWFLSTIYKEKPLFLSMMKTRAYPNWYLGFLTHLRRFEGSAQSWIEFADKHLPVTYNLWKVSIWWFSVILVGAFTTALGGGEGATERKSPLLAWSLLLWMLFIASKCWLEFYFSLTLYSSPEQDPSYRT